jgi:hypothetical protein
MGKRHPNPNVVKIHISYSVENLVKLFGVHANTIRAWRDQGMTPNDDSKPALFHGTTVAAFLRARRALGKRPCLPGQIFCLGCRRQQHPALQMADYLPKTDTRGMLQGMCPDCGALINRAVSLAGIGAIKGNLDVTIRNASPRING